MAAPDTTNTPEIFVSRAPAWEMGVQLDQTLAADIQTSRSGLEQRQARTSRSRLRLTYSAHLTAAQRADRIERMLAEVRAPLQVPIWPKGGLVSAMADVATLTLGRTAGIDYYQPGHWILLTTATALQFRQIASRAGAVLTLEAMVGATLFPAGSRVYPCRLCLRSGGSGEFQQTGEETHVERLIYQTL